VANTPPRKPPVRNHPRHFHECSDRWCVPPGQDHLGRYSGILDDCCQPFSRDQIERQGLLQQERLPRHGGPGGELRLDVGWDREHHSVDVVEEPVERIVSGCSIRPGDLGGGCGPSGPDGRQLDVRMGHQGRNVEQAGPRSGAYHAHP